MNLDTMIAQLTALRDELGGETTVLITDGFDARCYNGEYEIAKFVCDSGEACVDIGIGGMEGTEEL